MKNKLLLFSVLLFLIPEISSGTETHTLDIEFAFATSDDPGKRLLGYRLYQEGVRVCEKYAPTKSSITCTFPSKYGTFDFTLTAYYSDKTESPHSPSFPFTIDSVSITPPGTELLQAVISATPTSGTLSVNYSGTASTGDISTYSWEFGDGTTATSSTSTHTYTTAGIYQAKLTVKDSQGQTDASHTSINVLNSDLSNKKPTATISATPIQCKPTLSVLYDGLQSSDSDGSITQYNWNFGDGTTGSGSTVQHTYPDLAVYTVSLQVTNERGETATAVREITCNAERPDLSHPPIFLQTIYKLLLLNSR